MNRRDLIGLLGSTAAAWPLAAHAQQPTMALVGLLTGNQLDDRWLSAVGQRLKEVGYIEGRNAAIKYRSAGGRFDRLPALAVSGRSSGRHRYAHARGCAGRQSCDQNYPDRIRDRCRPGRSWSRFQS